MPRCKVCAHSGRDVIDRALVAGASVRDVSGQFSIPKSSVARHSKAHIPESLRQAQEIAELARCEDLVARTETLLRESIANYRGAAADVDAVHVFRRAASRNAATRALEETRRIVAMHALLVQERELARVKEILESIVGRKGLEYIEGKRGTWKDEPTGVSDAD